MTTSRYDQTNGVVVLCAKCGLTDAILVNDEIVFCGRCEFCRECKSLFVPDAGYFHSLERGCSRIMENLVIYDEDFVLSV